MKLYTERKAPSGFYRIGFDKYSGNYLMETSDMSGNKRYFVLSQEQYQWFDTEPNKLEALYEECIKKNNKSDIFFFSNWQMENSNQQNDLMLKYMYRDLLIEKSADEVHRTIGAPDSVLDDGKIEVFQMSLNLQIRVEYRDAVCCEVWM